MSAFGSSPTSIRRSLGLAPAARMAIPHRNRPSLRQPLGDRRRPLPAHEPGKRIGRTPLYLSVGSMQPCRLADEVCEKALHTPVGVDASLEVGAGPLLQHDGDVPELLLASELTSDRGCRL